MGATWDLAAAIAGFHASTPRAWNTRGETLLASLTDDDISRDGTGEMIHIYAATNPSWSNLAHVAFHLAVTEASALCVVGALGTISRAAGTDWKAAAHLLKILPQAKPFRPDPRLELTGPEGGPIPVTVRDEARSKLEAMADRLAENEAGKRAKVAEEPTPTEE